MKLVLLLIALSTLMLSDMIARRLLRLLNLYFNASNTVLAFAVNTYEQLSDLKSC